MKDTDLKHLTLKTAFLLALASGKPNAWVANKVCNLGQWEKVTLFPSSVVAAQVLDPSPQASYPWKERGGGGGGAFATTKSSGV